MLVLYDNHRGRGHHRHVRGRILEYEFEGLDELIRDFLDDVEEARREP